jgi:hypothetical protein
MQKKIEFENGNLSIEYWKGSRNILDYIDGKFSNPIILRFTCYRLFNKKKCIEYIKEIMPEIENETEKVIKENIEFYKNFDISISPSMFGYIGPINTNFVGECEITIECKLKILVD